MRFVIDAQLPPTLARWLASLGHQAEHVADLRMQAAPDDEIRDFALLNAAVIVAKDEDFAQRHTLHGEGPAVIGISLPNTRRRELPSWFADVLPRLLAALDRGETLIEVV